MSVIQKIIDVFAASSRDDQTSSLFGRWLLNDTHRTTKEEALLELWRVTPSASATTERALKAVNDRLFTEPQPHRRRMTLWMRVAVAAAMIIPPISVLLTAVYIDNFKKSHDATYTEYVVASGSIGRITLSDGTQVTLNAGSALIYPDKFVGSRRAVYLNGEASFDVVRNEKLPFVVNTTDFDIEVLGTHFNISTYLDDDMSTVVLKQGSIRVCPNQTSIAPFVMKVGECVGYDRTSRSYAHYDLLPENVMGWHTGELYFKRATLDEVVRVVERRFDVRISHTGDTKFSRAVITAKFVDCKTLDEVMRVLKKLIPDMRYRVEERNVYMQ